MHILFFEMQEYPEARMCKIGTIAPFVRRYLSHKNFTSLAPVFYAVLYSINPRQFTASQTSARTGQMSISEFWN